MCKNIPPQVKRILNICSLIYPEFQAFNLHNIPWFETYILYTSQELFNIYSLISYIKEFQAFNLLLCWYTFFVK